MILEEALEGLKRFSPQLAAFTLTSAGALIAYFARARVSLVWGVATEFSQTLVTNADEGTIVGINSKRFIIRNQGRSASESAEAIFNYPPEKCTIWPQREYSVASNPEGRFIVKFPSVAPKEILIIEMLCINREIPFLLDVRDKNGIGKHTRFTIVKQSKPAIDIIVRILALVGIFYLLLLTYRLVVAQ